MYVEISTQEVENVAAKGEIHVVYKKKIVDEKMYKQCKGKINKEHNYNKGRSGKKFGTVLWGNTSLYCPDPYQIPIAVNIEIDTSPPIHWRSKKSKKSLKYLKALGIDSIHFFLYMMKGWNQIYKTHQQRLLVIC